MALSSLRFKHSGDTLTQAETKSGSYIYDGSVTNFHEWEFRTEMRISAALACVDSDGEPKKQGIITAVNKIVEGLRGDAFDMAMDIGKVDLLTEQGINQLITNIRSTLFPIEAQEAKILFQSGQRPYGPMSRHNGESMISYISRRKRWWKLVTKLDTKLVMSDDMLGSLLLDHGGLPSQENLMVMTSTGNVTSFDKIKDVLILQHGRIHIRQKGKGDSGKGDQGNSSSTWTYRPNFHRNKGKGKSRPTAYNADYYDWHEQEEQYPEQHSPYGYYSSGYLPEYGWDDSAWDQTRVDNNWGTAYHSSYDDSEQYWSPVYGQEEEDQLDYEMIDEMTKAGYTEEEAAGVIQETLVANFGSKGKGKGKRSGKSFNAMRKGGGKGAPTLEDRKQRLKEIKARSRCNACKEMGHWAGDPECKG